jgi:hypothetical protein
MKKNYFTTVLLCALLSACATTNSYHPPSAGASATVVGQLKRNGWVDWETYTLHSIDGKSVSTFWSGSRTQVALAPGAHSIVVHAVYNRTLGGACPCETYVELPVEVASSKCGWNRLRASSAHPK